MHAMLCPDLSPLFFLHTHTHTFLPLLVRFQCVHAMLCPDLFHLFFCQCLQAGCTSALTWRALLQIPVQEVLLCLCGVGEGQVVGSFP